MGILWLKGNSPSNAAECSREQLLATTGIEDEAVAAQVQESAAAVGAFEALWRHYLHTRFLYPAKLERIATALPSIRSSWPLLLHAHDDLFQIHAAWDTTHHTEAAERATGAAREWLVSSSISAFRDSADTYVIQHAASLNTERMLACIMQCLNRINADPSFQYNRMYYRVENGWPRRVTETIESASPRGLSGRYSQAYLYAPYSAPDAPEERSQQQYSALTVREMSVDDIDAAYQIVLDATGDSVVTQALGFSPTGLLSASPAARADALYLVNLNQRFSASGLRRTRQGFVVEHDQRPIGVALQYRGSTPMNFSFLDTRTEIHLSPHVPAAKRAEAAQLLASVALRAARLQGDPVVATLVDERDRVAVAAGGFHDTGKSYASFVWQRENADGAPAGPAGIHKLYNRVRER